MLFKYKPLGHPPLAELFERVRKKLLSILPVYLP
jgi:hypothetical protein